MRPRRSREKVIASKWWEAKAQEMLKTTRDIGKVEVAYALLPMEDEKTAIRLLKERPDLDTLCALHCRYQDLSKEQRTDPSKLALDVKANELWRNLRMPPGYGGAPWDWNWQPPLSGIASEIADEFHMAVCRAVFRIAFLDFVKWALGCDALFIRSLFNAVRDVRNRLQREIQDSPGTKDIYLKVQKILDLRHLKLAHWLVADSVSDSLYPLEVALSSIRDPIQDLFATRNLNLVLERLPVFDQRFQHMNQKYNWSEWSTDLDFCNRTHQALWSRTPRIPAVNPNVLLDDVDERVRFLRGFESVPEDEARGIAGRLLLIWKKFRPRSATEQRFLDV